VSLSISAASLVYVYVPVTDTIFAADPTADVVQAAFLPVGQNPAGGDWKAAGWTVVGGSRKLFYAGCLVGPGGVITLAAGIWQPWVKITDSPEIPVLPASGLLVVT
jgi:hypothetical protein